MDLDSENPSLDYQREVASIYNLHLQSIVSWHPKQNFCKCHFSSENVLPMERVGEWNFGDSNLKTNAMSGPLFYHTVQIQANK